MKVLILTNNDVGLYKFRKELIEELICPGSYIKDRQEEPCQVIISLPNGDLIPKLKQLGCEFIETPIDRRGMNPIKDLKLLRHYKKIISRIKPDVVLTYTIKPNIYGGIVSWLAGVPYISNITGLGTSIEKQDFISKVILFMYRMGVYKADKVFFQNSENKSLFESKKIVRKQGILIPGSGVNLKEHCFEEYPKEEGPIRFLFVGRIMRDKGIGEYLDCAEKIKNKYFNVEFGIVGPYDTPEFRERIEKLNEKGVVQYYGPQEDVHSFIKKHHATVLPSYHEGLSNVLLESAASGRPVLASNVPGCMETFENRITGIGFNAKDSNSLINAVQFFLLLPYDKKKQMGFNARKKMEKEFDKSIVIRSYILAINQIFRTEKGE